MAAKEPVCLYLEVTNRCNLPCTTCPRTYEELEPEKDMSFGLFTGIVDQFDKREARRAARGRRADDGEGPAAHGRLFKARGVHVLFNTNGTLLKVKKSRELIAAGLDELRVSLDAAEAGAYAQIRGRDMFDTILRNLRGFLAFKREMGVSHPRVSLWLTGLKETIAQLPAFVRLAHEVGVMEVHLQRLVYFPEGQGMARPSSSLFESIDTAERGEIEKAKEGRASSACSSTLRVPPSPRRASRAKSTASPGRCAAALVLDVFHRPWPRLPCCIAPFSMHGYDSFTLGDAKTQTLREIWNGDGYRQFREELLSEKPPRRLRQLRPALELVRMGMPGAMSGVLLPCSRIPADPRENRGSGSCAHAHRPGSPLSRG